MRKNNGFYLIGMSIINKPKLEVFPPVLTAFTRRVETFVSSGHICPYCNGEGAVFGKQTGAKEYEIDECPICEGCRNLQANINIAWEPDRTNN